jgi:succinate dehydrogenase / fumarate reductase cytochrome b subunit
MGLLGFHLRHGFWSAFQSLGGFHPRLTPFAYALGVAAGIILAFGFLGLPIWFYLGGGTLS